MSRAAEFDSYLFAFRQRVENGEYDGLVQSLADEWAFLDSYEVSVKNSGLWRVSMDRVSLHIKIRNRCWQPSRSLRARYEWFFRKILSQHINKAWCEYVDRRVQFSPSRG